MAGVPASQLSKEQQDELLCSYAALILHDTEEAEITADAMTKVILDDANKQAEEIRTQAAAAFKAEKAKVLDELKSKIQREFDSKIKKLDTQSAIQRSTAINKARLDKVTERSEHLDKTVQEVRAELEKTTKSVSQYRALLLKLVVQGCLKLLEPEVAVQCRSVDKTVVESLLPEAERIYASTVQKEAKVARAVKLSLHPVALPNTATNPCLGGVVLSCNDGFISVDNTLDTRLNLVVELDKPTIRNSLFPSK